MFDEAELRAALEEAAERHYSVVVGDGDACVGVPIFGGDGAPDGLETGYYVKPTLFADVTNDMRIAREEIFGPVLVLIPYEDDDDAVRIANDSNYGLAGFVLGTDLERSMKIGRRVRAGSVGLNGGAPYGADLPFGGYKDSGVGRQNGISGFEQYLEVKSLTYPAGS